MNIINICDVPLTGDYKIPLIKGLITMCFIFTLGYIIGKQRQTKGKD